MIRKTILLLLFSLLLSCSTLNRLKEKEYMHIMVYDYDGNMVNGMKFEIDGSSKGESDIYGRLVIEYEPKKVNTAHTLKGTKSGYMTVEDEIKYTTSGVLYYKTGTAEQYLELAEKDLDGGNPEGALVNIERAEKCETAEDIIFLKSVIQKKLDEKRGGGKVQ